MSLVLVSFGGMMFSLAALDTLPDGQGWAVW